MDVLYQDLRLALRLLWKERSFAFTVVLTLAICIGASDRHLHRRPIGAAAAAAVSASRIGSCSRTTPFPAPASSARAPRCPTTSIAWRMTDVFDSRALYQFGGFRVGRGPSAEGVASMNVTPSFFRVLRAERRTRPAVPEEEAHPDTTASPCSATRSPSVNPAASTASSAATCGWTTSSTRWSACCRRTFTFLDPTCEIWVPLAFTDEQRAEERRHSQNHEEIARLAPGATLAQAQARIDALNVRIVERPVR